MTYNIIEGQWYGNMKAIERVKILTEEEITSGDGNVKMQMEKSII